MKITLTPPSPPGKGGLGDRGKENKLKAAGDGQQRGQAPLQAPQWQGKQATEIAKPPLQAPQRQGEQVPVQDTPPAGYPISRDSRYRRDIKYGYPPTYYPYSA